MATNLRLDERAAAALRDASVRTGRSQQDLLREAIDRYLGLSTDQRSRDHALAIGLVRAPSVFVDVEPSVSLGRGRTTLQLLARDDR